MRNKQEVVARELVALLEGSRSHMGFDDAVAELPFERVNDRPPTTPYSLWHFVEHIRIAQWDIIEFIRNPQHVSPDYPLGYRPAVGARIDAEGWLKSLEGVRHDLQELKVLAGDPATDLFTPLPHAPGYTIFQGILTAAAHNSYHIGELALLRQVMGLWPPHLPYLTGKED